MMPHFLKPIVSGNTDTPAKPKSREFTPAECIISPKPSLKRLKKKVSSFHQSWSIRSTDPPLTLKCISYVVSRLHSPMVSRDTPFQDHHFPPRPPSSMRSGHLPPPPQWSAVFPNQCSMVALRNRVVMTSLSVKLWLVAILNPFISWLRDPPYPHHPSLPSLSYLAGGQWRHIFSKFYWWPSWNGDTWD